MIPPYADALLSASVTTSSPPANVVITPLSFQWAHRPGLKSGALKCSSRHGGAASATTLSPPLASPRAEILSMFHRSAQPASSKQTTTHTTPVYRIGLYLIRCG